MQGIIFMSFTLISLFNTRFLSHLVSFHFFFFKNKIIHFYMWSSVFFLEIRIKCRQECRKVAQKTLKQMVPWEKTFPFFDWLHLLALISRRNVGTRGHLRKRIILPKYRYLRFRIKNGAHFDLLNWLEKKHQGFWCWRIIILFILPSVRMVAKLI